MIDWLRPDQCRPPHRVTHPEHLEALTEALRQGWEQGRPALIGYMDDDRVQLISGSHRHAAAMTIGCRIPVKVYPRFFIEAIWGTDAWIEIINHPPLVTKPK